MQKWLGAQCFGPIGLAEQPDTTKQVFWNDQQVMKQYKKFGCWNCQFLSLNLPYEVIILVNLCGGVLYEGLFLTKQYKNTVSEVLDQLTLLNMQKWLDAQCFGPIDLAENANMA